MSATRCKSCEARIVFAATADGKLIPIDVKPVADGNLVLENVAAEIPRAVPFSPLLHSASMPVRYVSHFATCPDAPQHRRAR